ncbi:Rep family protein [Limosilactobacillus reuteri]|uniref:Rep family protein n=1 Tax=Limosilactobacillus reuteri TaxID=1598 RepID=UPI00235EC155|nr:Rep family protein [Limosilactobacillus reuteri]MDD1381321.1 Rep family protein [Limosilactobacillus reuteri]
MSDIRSQILMFTQQLTHLNCSKKELIEKVKQLPHLSQFALITHNKDIKPDNSPIASHIHLVLTFNQRVRITQVAKELDQREQYFESMTKRGKNVETSFNNAMAYLIHRTTQAKEHGKHQYDPSEVIANFNYKQLIDGLKQSTFYSPKQVLADFNSGNISKLEALNRIKNSNSPRIPQYVSSLNKIEEINNKTNQANWIKKHEKTHTPITIIWIYGSAGVGKTEFAKHIATKYSSNNKYDFTGSTKDLFQTIGTANSLIIDEIRPKDIKFNDLLKITDPYNYRKYAPSRYHDKAIVADTIIFTSPYSPIQFFNKYKLDNNDSFKQLQRRITLTIKITTKQIIQLVPKTKPIVKLTQEELLNAIAIDQTYSITYTDRAISKNTFIKPNSQQSTLSLADLL